MPDVNAALAATQAAVNDLIAAADKCGATWTAPRAPGKWSPSQVVEHVARSLEESANVVAGAPSKLPTLPAFVRPFVRPLVRIFFYRILKKSSFPKARAAKALNPAIGSATPTQARVRLVAALAKFDEACRVRASNGPTVETSILGAVSIEDYVRFQELHTRHHCKQMPAAS